MIIDYHTVYIHANHIHLSFWGGHLFGENVIEVHHPGVNSLGQQRMVFTLDQSLTPLTDDVPIKTNIDLGKS